MKVKNIHVAYFSATYTTRQIIKGISTHFQGIISEHDLTQNDVYQPTKLAPDDLSIVGMPVYAGRIPAMAAERLKKITGEQTPAILIVVYGNRDYDDALLELQDIAIGNGFSPISAGAFVAQHSIFPKVGISRPDRADHEIINDFAEKSAKILEELPINTTPSPLAVKGNRPYKTPGNIPLTPQGNSKCNHCGTCVRLCPSGAISAESPRKTDKSKCIACGRCIVVCPHRARHFGGLLYWIAGRKFVKANSARKEAEVFFQH